MISRASVWAAFFSRSARDCACAVTFSASCLADASVDSACSVADVSVVSASSVSSAFSLAIASWVCFSRLVDRPTTAQVRPLLPEQLGRVGGGLRADRLRLGLGGSDQLVDRLPAPQRLLLGLGERRLGRLVRVLDDPLRLCCRCPAVRLDGVDDELGLRPRIGHQPFVAGFGLGLALGDLGDRLGPQLVDLQGDRGQLGALGLLELGGTALQLGPVLAPEPFDLGVRLGDLDPGLLPGELHLTLDRGPQLARLGLGAGDQIGLGAGSCLRHQGGLLTGIGDQLLGLAAGPLDGRLCGLTRQLSVLEQLVGFLLEPARLGLRGRDPSVGRGLRLDPQPVGRCLAIGAQLLGCRFGLGPSPVDLLVDRRPEPLGLHFGVGLQPLRDRRRLGPDSLSLSGRLGPQLRGCLGGLPAYPLGFGGGLGPEPVGVLLGLRADPLGLGLGLGAQLLGGALRVVQQTLGRGHRLGPLLLGSCFGLGLQALALGPDPLGFVAGQVVLPLCLLAQRVGDPLGPLEHSACLPHAKGTGVDNRFLGQWQTRSVHATR